MNQQNPEPHLLQAMYHKPQMLPCHNTGKSYPKEASLHPLTSPGSCLRIQPRVLLNLSNRQGRDTLDVGIANLINEILVEIQYFEEHGYEWHVSSSCFHVAQVLDAEALVFPFSSPESQPPSRITPGYGTKSLLRCQITAIYLSPVIVKAHVQACCYLHHNNIRQNLDDS